MPSSNIPRKDDTHAGAATEPLPVTGYAVLGQLAAGPASGYDVQSRLQASAAHFWHASYSQIYAELRRLERLGLASEERVVQDRRPNKRVYTITPAGREALVEWLVKLMLADPLPADAVVAEVRRLKDRHERRREEFAEEMARLPPDAGRYVRLALRKGERAQAAFAAWCQEVIDELEGDGR
jgi:DNA-binding PadR family transcriptional regulator